MFPVLMNVVKGQEVIQKKPGSDIHILSSFSNLQRSRPERENIKH
jgi:hypothetical protein